MDEKNFIELCKKCIDRAENVLRNITPHHSGFDDEQRLSIVLCLKYSNVDIEALASAEDNTFIHDMFGIMRFMDKKKKVLDDSFTPTVGFRNINSVV